MALEKRALGELFSKCFELSLESRVADLHRVSRVPSRVDAPKYISEYFDLHKPQIPDNTVVLKKSLLFLLGKVTIWFHPTILEPFVRELGCLFRGSLRDFWKAAKLVDQQNTVPRVKKR